MASIRYQRRVSPEGLHYTVITSPEMRDTHDCAHITVWANTLMIESEYETANMYISRADLEAALSEMDNIKRQWPAQTP